MSVDAVEPEPELRAPPEVKYLRLLLLALESGS